MTDNQDEPLPLIKFIKNGEKSFIQLRQETVDILLPKIGELLVSILTVWGPSRQGKSFFLGYLIRRLEGLEKQEDDWMGWKDQTKPLSGFRFLNGSDAITQGIWVWSRPFIIKNTEGNEVAVLLVDTQGIYDENTSNKDMATIVGMSFLMSSVSVFNIFTNLQDDMLTALDTYVQYGLMALEEEGCGAPFQKLVFLIRDWNNWDEFPYGIEGGAKFLRKKLEVKKNQSKEAAFVRGTIHRCFQDLECFLMPAIGKEALSKKFRGSLSELPTEFSSKLEECIRGLIAPENIVIKKVQGSSITGLELKALLETYTNAFNSDELPSADQMWQATSRLSNSNAMEKAIKNYKNSMNEGMQESSYLSINALLEYHERVKAEAINGFKKSKKSGSPEMLSEFEEKLISTIEEAFSRFQQGNENRRQQFIAAATSEAAGGFQAALQSEFPFCSGDDMKFYDESEIIQTSLANQSNFLGIFKGLLSNEPEDELFKLVKVVEKDMEGILNLHLRTNKDYCSNAEKQLESLVQIYSSAYHSKFHANIANNRYEEDDSNFEAVHKSEKSEILEDFKTEEKPGSTEFQQGYLTKLEEKIDQVFTQLINEHQSNLQKIKFKSGDCIKACALQHKQLFNDKISNELSYTELLNLHETCKAGAISKLKSTLPVTDNVVLERAQSELSHIMEANFAEGKKLFESLQAVSQAKKDAKTAVKQAQIEKEKAVQAEMETIKTKADAEITIANEKAAVAEQMAQTLKEELASSREKECTIL